MLNKCKKTTEGTEPHLPTAIRCNQEMIQALATRVENLEKVEIKNLRSHIKSLESKVPPVGSVILSYMTETQFQKEMGEGAKNWRQHRGQSVSATSLGKYRPRIEDPSFRFLEFAFDVKKGNNIGSLGKDRTSGKDLITALGDLDGTQHKDKSGENLYVKTHKKTTEETGSIKRIWDSTKRKYLPPEGILNHEHQPGKPHSHTMDLIAKGAVKPMKIESKYAVTRPQGLALNAFVRVD